MPLLICKNMLKLRLFTWQILYLLGLFFYFFGTLSIIKTTIVTCSHYALTAFRLSEYSLSY